MSVARPGKWGNPFAVGSVGPSGDEVADRATAVTLFREMLVDPSLRAAAGYPSDLSPLRGKNLACWCSLDGPCHADVLFQFANELSKSELTGRSDPQ